MEPAKLSRSNSLQVLVLIGGALSEEEKGSYAMLYAVLFIVDKLKYGTARRG